MKAAHADYFKRVPTAQTVSLYFKTMYVFFYMFSAVNLMMNQHECLNSLLLYEWVSKQIKVIMIILRRFKTTDYLTKKDIAKITDTLALINIKILLALASKLVRTTIIYVSFKSISR